MTDLVLLLYALCGIVTFWAVFTGAAGATDDDPPADTFGPFGRADRLNWLNE